MLITDAAVREAAANLAQSLGGDWAVDTAAPADGAAHLVYSDGRGISFRPIFGGTTVQLWITGSAAPPLPDDATLAERAVYEAQVAARLPEGHRYNQSTTLVTETDENPEHIILSTLEDALLPAFECKPRYVGHRPWIDLFDNALAAATAEREAPSVVDDHGHDHEAEVEPPPQDGVEPNADADSNAYVEPDGGGEEVAAEESALLKQAFEEVPSPEPDTEPEAAPESTSDGTSNGNDTTDQPVSEPNPATSRRPRKRNPKRRTTATATESTS
ncbi:hypothetical protein G3I77_02280 [Streptomyces sp. D2-8]|uniref:hypothetical protein n=1 Tax=Streptomyces sp. D2-8 TaxID=2707767 RepID=UPI0020C0DBBA|nr:hypothetical protein [Streptomyces sp. D2-8]MCK8431891.1 hypothetical protein [Streptomyces sp. D2-8]